MIEGLAACFAGLSDPRETSRCDHQLVDILAIAVCAVVACAESWEDIELYGLWRLQRAALPGATPVLDWWHAAVRFEHALQAARGLGTDTADAHLVRDATAVLERAKWGLWHGRWTGCRGKLASLCRWTKRKHVRDVAGIGRLQRHVSDLRGYLERNRGALVPYAARRRRGEPISTAFVESAVNEIVAKRMNKAQQMRWNRATVQPFLDVRTAVLNDRLEDAFRQS